jgi:hypothetical protein
MNSMKELARAVIRRLAARAPCGAQQDMLDGYIDRISDEAFLLQVLQRFKIVEIGADGGCGVIASAWNDQVVLLLYAANGTGSPTVTRATLDLFGDGPDTYMDVGANIGVTAIPVARNQKIRCLAFEPEPVNFGHLIRNVARNAGGASVEFHQVALFDSHSTMSMALAYTNLGDHRLTQGIVSDRA